MIRTRQLLPVAWFAVIPNDKGARLSANYIKCYNAFFRFKEIVMEFVTAPAVVLMIFLVILVYKSIHTTPQSQEFVVERFGKYTRTLPAGINLIVPFLDKVAHKLSILERQLDEINVSVITKDNVEVDLKTTVFYRITDAAKSIYRIQDIDRAVQTAAESIVRSAAGKLELDELQSSRETMNNEIFDNLKDAAVVWGIEITRTEITDVLIDELTKNAQRQQLNAEREKRAIIAKAEAERRRVELEADATLYDAKKQAEAVKVAADADAYAVKIAAEAEAEQTRVISEAIANNGQPAIDYDILKRQVEALGVIGSSQNSKTVLIPTDVTKTVGSLSAIVEFFNK